jgi:hypothetical protein
VTGAAHHHKGFGEVYTVHAGTLLVYADSARGPFVHVLSAEPSKCTLVVPERWNHTVYALPATVYLVQTLGAPIANPRTGGNDWWPAPPSFEEYSNVRLCEIAKEMLKSL